MKHIAIIGHGTIGRGVSTILLKNAARVARAVGDDVRLVAVCDKDSNAGESLPDGLFTNDVRKVIDDKTIDVAVELIGGLEPARTIVIDLLKSGKNVVTANKALLANHGRELFETARKHGRTISFEAAVAGGIPVIASLATSLQANTIKSIRGILNGTSNFILSSMDANDTSYEAELVLAQQLGYAEANPAMDVDGSDAAQKLAILTQLAFGVDVDWKKITRRGITSVAPIDFLYAQDFGYAIKLVASAEATPQGLALSVLPTLVRADSMLSRVEGPNNALEVVGDNVGRLFYHGAGAGQFPTASAVVSDVIDTLLGRTAITFSALDLWSDSANGAMPVLPTSAIVSRSYLRLTVDDRPGVLGEITSVIGRNNISVSSVLQHDAPATDDDDETFVATIPDTTPLILLTHPAPESQFTAAIAALENLASVRGPIVRFGVE
ncbi:MAG: homoserine dehydrogenase [Thermoguttaceae bacterium]